MRAIFIPMLMAAGIGLTGTSAATAASISGSALLNAAADMSPVEQVQRHSGGGRAGVHGGGGDNSRSGVGGGVRVTGRSAHVVDRGVHVGNRVRGGRFFRGGRWVYYGGCSYEIWILGLCY